MDHILNQSYDLIDFKSKKMEGYGSNNYKISTADKNYVLKVYTDAESEIDWLHAENRVLKILSAHDNSSFPKPLANNQGESLTIENKNNGSTAYRLLSFVDGQFFSDIEASEKLFYSLGNFMAKLDQQLINFVDPAISARKIVWDLQCYLLNEKLIIHITDPQEAKLVKYFTLQYKEEVIPVLDNLRKSTIHNDANNLNLLTQNGLVSGIIDFGDMVYGPLICELAIAITYAIMGKEDILKWTIPIVKGYHEEINLEAQEIDILYYLVAARLCTSVCNSAFHKLMNPESEYITVSEKPAWILLKKWFTINPIAFKQQLKSAIGLSYPQPASIKQLVAARNTYLSSSLSTSYETPILMEKAAFQYMYDGYGTTYLDAYNNIPHVGHQHPDVVAAGRRQMSKLNTNTRYVYELLAQYAEALVNKFPSPLKRVFFVNSGSAASDLAIRLALNYSRNHHLMVMEHGYHGNTRLGIDVSHYKYNSKGGKGKVDNIIEATLPNQYRLKSDDPTKSLGEIMAQKAIEDMQGKPVAAFIAEPIVGCGGQVPLAPGYLNSIYSGIRSQGGLCISDEVQVGFGRLGETYWGFEYHGVIPDIVILGKPMGNGHPIGAVVTTAEVADAFDNGMEFFSSFGGNPVSCAIGLAVLEVIEKENLQENAKMQGNYFKHELSKLSEKYACLGDVRGSGLFLGIEFVKDSTTKIHDTATAQFLKNALKEKKILVSTDGPKDSVIKMKPPLCFNQDNVDEVVNMMDNCLKENF